MTPPWLREFRRRLSARPAAPVRRPRARLRAEELEDRSTPATITWTGGAGDLKWETAGNWDLNRLPTSTDDAVIPDIGAAGPSLTVTLDSGTPTVRSITAAENLTLSGANTVLTLSGGTRTVSVGGTFTLDGGAIAGAVLASPTVGRTGRTTLDGVTLDAPLDLTQAGGVSVQLRGDIVLNSTVSVGAAANAGASAEVYLAADTSITTAAPAGTGAFVLGGGGSNTLFRGNFRTTIGPGVLVRGWKGGIGTGGPLVNRGTIRKDVGPADNGGTMSVNPGSGGRNEGVIETTVPGTLQVSNINNGPWTNAAGGTISASGGALVNIGLNTSVLATPDTWTNLGIISVAAGTRLDLYGQLTQAKIGTLVQDPTSLVNLAGGTLTGGLTLSDATGSYRLAGMTIQGGTYSVAPGSTAALLPTVNGGTLDGVTIDAPLDLSVVNNASVTLAGNVVLNSVVSIGSPAANGSYGQVRTLGDTAITTTAPAGTARFVFGSSGNNFLVQSRYSDALTIGPGVLIRGQTGGIGLGGGLRFTNRGTIRRDVAGGATLQVYFGGGGRNEGVIEATAPGLLALQGNAGVAWTNAAGATIAASGGATVDVGGDAPQTWTNQGTISAATAPGVSPTTVRFRGQLTRAGIGTVARDAGSVVQLFNGAVLTGGLALTTADGEWVLNGGTVQGGTVSATGAGKLVGASGILDGVTLNTPIDLTRTVAAALGVRNGLVLNAVVPVGSADGRTYAQVSPAAGAVITTAGGGGFVLGPNRSNAVYAPNGTVTVGPGVTVRAAGGTVGAGGAFLNSGAVTAAGGRVDLVLGPGGVNFGTIRVEAPAQARLIGGGWVNAPGGRIEVAGGAVDTAAGAADRWTNLGTIAATDLVLGPFQNYAPVVNLAGTFAQRDLGSFTRTPRTTVNLVGTLVGGLTLDDTLGSWNIAGGTLRGGRFAVAPGSGARLTATAVNNYLTQGVTLDAPIDLTGGGSPGLVVTGGLTLNATLAVGGAAGSGGGSVQFTGGTQELRTDGGGRVVFGASGGNSLTVTRGGTLTIGPGVVVEGEAGYVGLAAPGAADTIVNRGTIRATVPGPRAVTINPGVFQNLGTVRATNGARLNVQPATTNLNLSGPTVTVGSAKVVAATLAGGTWGADAGGRVWLFPTGLPISLNGPAPGDYAVIRVDRNAAAVVLDGPTSGFVNGSTAAAGLGLADPFAALAENLGPGSFTVRNNRPFTPAPAFVNRGDLTIGIGAANAPGGTSFRQLGGTLTVDGTFAPPGGTLTVEGGVVGGVGVIQGDVVNGGTVAPGASPGFLRVFGNYAQTAAGVLDLEVAGRDGNVPEYDRLQVTGDAVIAGTIRGTLADTFQPAPGDAFTVVTAKTLTLQGPRYELPAPGGSLRELAPVPAADKLTLVARRVPPIGFGYATTMGGPQAPAPDPATTRPNRVALDAAGNSYVTGVIGDGTTDLDREGPGGAQGDIPVGQGEVFLAKYDPAGRVVWVRTFGRSNDGPAGLAVAVDGRGNADPADDRVYVAGSQFGGFDVGGFIRRYRPDGTLEAVADLDGGSSGSSEVGGLAVGPTGNVVVAGRANEFVDLDPGPGAVFPPAGREFFVAEYTPALAYVRSAFLASTSAAPAGVAVDAAGDVWVGGTFGGALGGLGTGPLVSAGGGDAFLVKFRGSGGTFTDLLSRRYGDTDADSAAGVAVAPDGSVYLAGTFRRAVDFDPAADRAFTLISGGEGDVFVLKLAAEGAFRWARAVGGFRADAAGDVAVDPAGNVYLTGGFSDAVDFDPLDGTFLLSTAPGTAQQAFVAALDPAGQFRWAAQLGDRPGAVAAGRGVAADAAGRVASVGLFENTVDFDPTGGTALRSFTPPAPGAPAGYVSLLTQKAAPRVSIAGVPAGPVPQGATLALAAAVTDPDSTSFTYAWAVQRGTDAPLVGAGPVFGAVALRPGVYTVTLVVTDETGNSTTATARVSVTNAAPRLNPTSYASAAALPEPAPAAGAGVGSSLATGGGFTLAGAPGAGVGGAVRVYDAAGAFVRTLVPPAPAAGMQFGAAAAVVGGFAVVGAPGLAGGAAHVYRLSDGAFVRTLAGPAAVAGDRFGASVAAFGNFVLVGAPGRTTPAGAGVGAAYLLDPATGVLVAAYANPAATPGDGFGAAVAAVGGLVLIGSPGNDAAGLNAGAVFVFDPATGRAIRTLTSTTPAAGSQFGAVLAAAGLRAAVGAPAETVGGTLDAGAVSVFDLDPASFLFGRQLLGLRNPAAGAGRFGAALAGAGNRLLVGAPADGGSGTALVFDIEPGSGTFGGVVQSVKKAAPAAGDRLGAAVAFADRDVLAGAAGDDTTAAEGGRVYRAAPAAFVTQTAADPLAEGGTLTVSGSFTDPGLLDGHTAIIVWGNGYYTRIPLAGGTNVFSATYQYLDDDPTGTPQDDYAVRVRVADDYADVLTVDRQTIGDSITRFDGSTGAEAGTLASSLVPAPGGGTPPFSSGVAVGPDGLLYVAYSGGLRSVFRFDPTSGESLGAFATGIPAGPGGQGNNLRFGPDGNLYLRDAVGRMLRRFDGRTGAALPLGAEGTIFGPNPAPFAGPGGLTYRPSEFAFGPDGHVYLGNFYLAGGLYRWAVLKYDGTTGTFLGYALGGPEAVPPGATIPYEPVGLTFGPDGDLFILADQTPGVGVSRAAFQYDLTTGELVRVIAFSPTPGPGGAVGGDDILFTPDNALLYLDVEAGTVDRYDLATGRFIDEFIPGGLDYTAGGLLLGVSPEDVTVAAQTVRNVAPAVAVRPAPNPAGAPAGAFTLSADVADPGTRDTLVYAWAVTAGTVSSSSVSPDGRSFTYVPAGGALTIALTVTDDDTGSATAGTRVVFGTAAGETITLSNTQSKVGSAAAVGYGAGVDRIVVYGLGGDDTISAAGMTAAAGLPVVLVGGNGADSLTGGPKADLLLGNSPGDYDAGTDDHAGDTLAGGGGNDTLDGGLGNDSVAGGDDDDTYSEGPGSDDVLSEQGTTGTDTIDYGIAAFGITFGLDRDGVAQVVNPSAPAGSRHTVKALGKFENLVGSPFADDLGGDDGPNAIDGGGGNDIIFGGPKLGPTAAVLGGGRDTLVGGTGNDTVRGGAGNDVIYGGLRPAAAFALTGADPGLPDGVADDDEIEGGGGDNFIDGGGGNDRIFGGVKTGAPAPGNSTLVGGKGNDTVRGGAGNDVIYGGLRPAEGLSSAAEFTAADDDEIEGLGGDDFIDGGAGSDRIFGGVKAGTAPPPGKPTLVGGTGNDTIRGGAGNDVIYGGNRLADVPGQSTAAADDDEIEGLGGDDFIDGGAGSDRIFGGVKAGTAPPPGKPTLVGGTGNDTIRGGAGNDVIYGATLIGTAFAGPDDDDIEGAGGDDLIDGGVGNDRIFGGVKTGAAPAGSPTLIGGRGNDTVVGGAGNDVIYGDDRLALTGADPATPAVGGVKLAAVRAFAADDDEIEGGWGDDAIDGGTGNDRIFGGVKAGTPPPAGATDRDTLRGGLGNDTVRGGAGNDVIYGGAGDDDLGGGDGDDIADGGSGLDLLTEAGDADLVLTATTITVGGRAEPFFDIEGVSFAAGPGANRLDASAFPGPVALDGGAGNDTLLGTAFGDVLAGGPGDDSVVAGAGADRLDAGGGNDVLDGGDDNDVYLIPLSGVVLVRDGQGIDGFDLSAAGLAAVADLAAGTVIDAAGNRVTAPAGAIENLTATGFDDTVRGSADRNILSGGGGADALDGGAEADTLRGGFLQVVYLDFDSASGAGEYRYTVEDRNRIQARLEAAYAAPFTVAFTQTRPPAGRYATVVINAGEASENEVLAGGVAAVDARNADPGAGAAVNVNGFVGRAGQPPATPDNTVGLTATVVAHELGHLFGLRHADAAGPIGRNPATGLAYGVNPGMFEAATARETVAGAAAGGAAVRYALKNVLVRVAAEPQVGDAEVPFRAPAGVVYDGPTAVATFTVNTAGGVDLTPVGSPARRPVSGTLVRAGGNPADPPTDTIALAWDAAPAESSVDVLYQYSPVRPAYPGPADAGETVRHIMASPASLGSSVADAIAPTWFGERELIKMAWADAGVSRPEAALPTAAASGGLPAPVTSKVGAGGRVKDLGNLPELAVPNLLPQGATHSGKTLAVRAAGVVGRLDLNSATGRAESDVYAVAGRAGEFLSAELYSVTLRQRLAPFDGVIRVYGPAGQVLAYFGRPAGAESDDGVDNEDPALQDVELPADGTYFVEVDTYADARVGDRAFGGYELFVYTYATPAAPAGLPPGRGSGDSLAGGAGADTVTGGSGGDLYVGSETEDAFLGRTDVDQTVGTLAARPTAAVVLTPDRLSPGGPGAPLVAAVTAAGTPGVPVFLSYVWSVDGAVVRTLPSTAATRDVLPVVGFRAGQVVSVTVTPRDANGVGRPVTASVVAGDAPPAAQPQTLTVLEDAALAAPLDLSDPTGLPVAPAVRRAPAHGAVTFDATGLGFRYTPAPDYHGADLFRYAGVSRLGAGNEAVVSVTVVPVNDAPSFAPGADVTVAEDAGRQLRVGWATGISAGPANEAGQGLAFLVTTDNPGLFAAGPAVAPDGTLSFTPAADAFGVATVTVVLRDDGGTEHGGRDTSAARTFTVTVTPVNDAPTVPSGTFTTPQDTPFAGQAAGADPDDVALTYAVVTNPAHGAVVLDPLTGAFTYTPAAGYTGPDEFTYRASDGRLDSNRGTAAITVGPTAGNAAPVAGADAAETTEDAAVLVDAPGVLGNDTDPNAGDTLAVSAVAGEPANVGRVVPLPSGASVRVTADGGFAYDPNGVFNGLKAGQTATDSFTYEVSDGKGGTATGTVTVTIAGRNDPPAATVALDLTAPKTSDTLTATATKSDPDGDAVSLTFVWTVNGNTVRTFSSATALTDTLDLSVAGNGDAGDVVKVTVTPSDGAADGPAASAEATVAAGPPPAPAITGVGDDTGADAADGVTRDTTLTVTGTGTAGTTVTVYRDDVAVGTAAVGSSGGWVYDGTGTALADGPYTYTAAAAYPGGALGPVSAGYAVTVDTKAPEVRKFLVLYGPAGKEKEYDLVGASRLTLPWAVTGFRVVFSEPVVGTAAGLSLTDRLGKALAVSKVAGSGTDTLTWTPAAAITLDLVTAAVATSGTDAVADPAGNALATARTSFKPAVVLGDVTGDKKVNSLDLLAFRKVLTTAGSADPLYPFCDIDGDGDVDAADQKMLQDRIGKHLPT